MQRDPHKKYRSMDSLSGKGRIYSPVRQTSSQRRFGFVPKIRNRQIFSQLKNIQAQFGAASKKVLLLKVKTRELWKQALKQKTESRGDNFQFQISNFESNSNSLISKIKTLNNSDFTQNLKLKIKNLNPKHFFKIFKSRTLLKKSFALLTILAVIVTAYFQNTPNSQGATFSWTQTDWSGGATFNMKSHPDSSPPQ
jgi:hypothetical protein